MSASLLWTKPSCLRREFVLTEGADEIARLSFESFGSAARILTPVGWWRVTREGFWRARVIMRGGGELPLVARATWSGSYELDIAYEDAVRWRCLSMWRQQYGWTRADGAPLVVYRPMNALSQRVHAVDVLDDEELTTSRVLLIALGGYLLQRTNEDMAATAAAV